jgi:drug/metabolite transporter (DMT)-like permease
MSSSSLAPSTKLTNTATSIQLLLPYFALLAAQLITSSWHVLGKHVMRQVPYLDPISFVLIRTLLSSVALLLVGRIREGHVPFPPLFHDGNNTRDANFQRPASPIIERVDSFSLSLPSSHDSVKSADIILPVHRKKRRRKKYNTYIISAASLLPIISSIRIVLPFKYYQKRMNNLNREALRIIFAGLSGMLILPLSYTTGLILTSPTVASVWDGPLIPLGCFCAAVAVGFEKLSESHPISQIGSLLLTVIGSIVVLLVDYSGIGRTMIGDGDRTKVNGSNTVIDHTQFIRGNIILMGVVAAFSTMTLLQKSLSHHPSIHLTAWMFGIGFLGCFAVLLLDGLMGNMTTGCSLSQAVFQLYVALTTSPTFRFGVLYSALFVGGACFTIGSYASSHLESSVITLFAATQPPVTAVLEWAWEGNGFGWMKICGMACVCFGIYSFTWIKRVEYGTIRTPKELS